MEIPEFVEKHGAMKSDWVELHDRYHGESLSFKKAQEDWWLSNWAIRKSLAKIESSIDEKLRYREKISIQNISILQIAKGASRTRITVTHKDRIDWVNSERKRLRTKLSKPNRAQEDVVIDNLKSQVKDLKWRLNQQRNETLKWALIVQCEQDETKSLKQEIKVLKTKISNYEKIGTGSQNVRTLGLDS